MQAVAEDGRETATPENEPKGPALAEVDLTFVESLAALAAVRAAGLSPRAEVRSSSPAVLLDPEACAVQTDRRLDGGGMVELARFLLLLSIRVGEVARDVAVLRPHAAEIGRCVNYAEPTVLAAHCLSESDLARRVAVVVTPGEGRVPVGMGSRIWARFFPTARRVVWQMPEPPRFQAPQDGRATILLRRLRATDWTHMAYRAVERVWNGLPERLAHRPVLVAGEKGEHPLMKEVAFVLAARGVPIVHVPVPPVEPATVPEEIRDAVWTHVLPILLEELRPRVPAAAACAEGVAEVILERFRLFGHFVDAWEATLGDAFARRPRAVLVSKVLSPQGRALAWVARRHGVPVVTTQHGAVRELNEVSDRNPTAYETSEADLHLCYNDRCAAITSAGAFNRGVVHTVGIDRMQRRAQRSGRPRSDLPVWYLSAMLYAGRRLGVTRGLTDREMYEFEAALVREVFSRLSFDFVFKPYPESNYPDDNPVLSLAEARGVPVFRQKLDMRYLFDRASVLVTSSTVSTLGWCLGTGLPTVLIELPERPLASEARHLLEPAIFVVDGSRPSVYPRLHALLSRGPHWLAEQYAERKPARERAIATLIDGGSGDAGRRGAKLILGR